MLAFLLEIQNEQDRDYLSNMYYVHRHRLRNIAYAVVKNNEEAEDIVQDTFMKVARHIDDFIGKDEHDQMLLLIVYTKNTAIDLYRKKRRQKNIPLVYESDETLKEYEIDSQQDYLDEILINQERTETMRTCIDDLPQKQRHAVLLKFRFMYREKQIAEIMNTTETAVSSIICRAKKNLRKMMEERYHE